TPTPEPTPTPTPQPPRGELRLPFPRSRDIDTFDAPRSGERSLSDVLALTHSRLVAWRDTASATLAGDLATSWQQPDELTLILRLDARATWQDRSGMPA